MSETIHKNLLNKAQGKYPNLHKLLKLNGLIELQPKPASQLFEYLARTVVGQQLSVTAARTIWSRVELLANNKPVPELFYTENEQEVRTCGLSRSKFKAICGLREAIASQSLNARKLLTSDYEEVTRSIIALWGFGEWSADMCAISFCGLQDVYPGKDVSIVNGLQKLCGFDGSLDESLGGPCCEPSEQIAKTFSPYRSYLCYHIWRGMDNGFIR